MQGDRCRGEVMVGRDLLGIRNQMCKIEKTVFEGAWMERLAPIPSTDNLTLVGRMSCLGSYKPG